MRTLHHHHHLLSHPAVPAPLHTVHQVLTIIVPVLPTTSFDVAGVILNLTLTPPYNTIANVIPDTAFTIII
jgi:hypothetical protein